jgi:hypothetical protein
MQTFDHPGDVIETDTHSQLAPPGTHILAAVGGSSSSVATGATVAITALFLAQSGQLIPASLLLTLQPFQPVAHLLLLQSQPLGLAVQPLLLFALAMPTAKMVGVHVPR